MNKCKFNSVNMKLQLFDIIIASTLSLFSFVFYSYKLQVIVKIFVVGKIISCFYPRQGCIYLIKMH